MVAPTDHLDIPHQIEALLALSSDENHFLYGGTWYPWNEIRRVAVETRAAVADLGADAVIGVLCRNHPLVLGAVIGLLADGRCVLPFPLLVDSRKLVAEVGSLRPAVFLLAEQDGDLPGLNEVITSTGARRITVTADGQLAVAGRGTPGPGAASYPPGTAFVLQTSGTTGTAKRVPVSYRNLRASVSAMRARVAPGSEPAAARLRTSVALLNTPISHTSGMLSFCLNVVEGRRLALMDKFEPVAWSTLVRDCRIVSAGVPPAALSMVLDADIPPEWLASLKMIRSGTAPLDPDLAVRFEARYGVPVVQAYGATEFQGLTSWTLEDHRRWSEIKRGSVGRAHPGVELRVRDLESGVVLSPGERGRLEVRTEQSSVSTPDGWVTTNDIARIDAEEFVWILGRTDDVINRGGLKVDAVSVQTALQSHEWVESAAVVGIPDARLGEIPCAVVVLGLPTADAGAVRPTDSAIEAVLREHLRASLAPYMIPARFAFVDGLPRNAALKVDRPALKAIFA